MTSRDFCYWLQGWFELNETIDHREGATKETLDKIKNHLAMVFRHEIDPSMGDADHQKLLSLLHEQSKIGGTQQTAARSATGFDGTKYNC